MRYKLVSGPHTHSGNSSLSIMYKVNLALMPSALFAVYIFGLPAVQVILVAVGTAILSESLALLLRGHSMKGAWDGSAILTGLLLALSLPASIPLWMVALGASFAIIVGKHIYGGLGHNLFNPAMLARVMLLICFPVEMISWSLPEIPLLTEEGLQVTDAWLGLDAVTGATPLSMETTFEIKTLISGFHSGSLGETSAIALLAGGIFLLLTGVLRWHLPAAVILGITLPAVVFQLLAPEQAIPVSVHIFSGATLLVAFFLATDYVTSPTSYWGQVYYGIGIGLLMFIIRTWGNFPEGAAFAVLIMNSMTPVIDHFVRPATFGFAHRPAMEGKS